jgi:hypothetical protein
MMAVGIPAHRLIEAFVDYSCAVSANGIQSPMSAFCRFMSALPPKADIEPIGADVRL